MKQAPLFLFACLLLPLSATQLHAQVGAAVENAVGRAAVISTIRALEQEQFYSNKYQYPDHSRQFKVIQPDFRTSDFDVEFWYGAPTVVANPALTDGEFNLGMVIQLANSNYNTWRLAIGPYVDPIEYENLRQEIGKADLTKSDSMRVFYNTVTDTERFSKFRDNIRSKNPPKPKPRGFPASPSEQSESGRRWLYFFLFLYWVISTIGIWNIFYKAERRPKGYAFIPFWRLVGLCQVAGFQPLAALWLLVPVANIGFWVILHIRLCQNFGIPPWLGFLALVFPPGLWWIIGRSPDVWYQPLSRR
ncbi:MAG: DUF5684 domain-containing protein [Saprospiraceae bacterium]